jgi:hypothetical protein
MKRICVVFVVVLALAVPLIAHHSFAAEFDASKPVTLKGAVTKVEWTNPHIWIYMDNKDEKGIVTKWQCEMGSPNMLMRQGWRSDSLKQGDDVTIEGSRAKDGTNTCNARTVRLANGTRMFAGSSGGDAPPRQ